MSSTSSETKTSSSVPATPSTSSPLSTTSTSSTPKLSYCSEEAEDTYVKSEADRLLKRLLPKQIKIFTVYPGQIFVFDNDEKVTIIERDEKKFLEAQSAVHKLVKERKDEKMITQAEMNMHNVTIYTKFINAIDLVLKTPKKSAGIKIEPQRVLLSSPQGKKDLNPDTGTMIYFEYLEDYNYAKVKFGNADPSIEKEVWLTACDGLTFLQLLKRKTQMLLLDVVELINK